MTTSTTIRTRYPGVFKREGKRGTRYDVAFRDDEGKQRMRTFATLKEAREFKARTETQVRDGDYVDTRDKMTVTQYARIYLASRHDQRASTRARQASMVERHIAGTQLGRMPLVKVTREHVDAWLADRATHMQRSTLRTVASLLRSVLRYAVENGRIRSAPSVRVSARQADVDEGRFYAPSVDEVERLAEAMPTPTYRALVVVQAATGLRISELLALRVCDVSTQFRTVKVRGQLTRAGQRVATKTPTSERAVPMSARVAAVLEALIPENAEPDALVFTTDTGRSVRQNTYFRAFKAGVERAGLPKTLSSHDLRHHYATTLLRSGLSPVAVGKLLGHTDGSLVVRTYAHWVPDDDDLARQALDVAWGGAERSTATARLRAVR